MSFLTTELRIHKRPHYVQRQLDSHYSRAKAEHIAIIMFAALMRGIRVAAEGCANHSQRSRIRRYQPSQSSTRHVCTQRS